MFIWMVCVFVLFMVFYNFYWKRRKLPAGPTPLPLIGNLLTIIKKSSGVEVYKEWRDKYGPIFTVWLAEHPAIMICDYDLMVEAFIKNGENLSGRMQYKDYFETFRGGICGIIISEGETWKHNRKFVLSVFRNLGYLQDRILSETSKMIHAIQSNLKHGVHEHDIVSHTDITIGSIINSLLFGYSFYGENEHDFYFLKKHASKIDKYLGHPLLSLMWNYTKLAKYIPGLRQIYFDFKQSSDAIFSFLERQIEEHNKTDGREPKDLVDFYLRELKNDQQDGHTYSIKALKAILFDLWMAGQETTTTTIIWGIIYLIHNQDKQERLQEELDKIIGSNRLVTNDDRANLNYTMATIQEIQRIANISPLVIRRKNFKEFEINGHLIPKGSAIIPMISVLLADEKIFPEPDKFLPERFLDEKGELKKVNEFLPFSLGKRICIGENLARMELFLIISNIFHHFKISPTEELPSLKRILGTTAKPYPFKCHIERRF